jgi:adenylate kinase family enzyme
MTFDPQRIMIIGPSGSGKSTLARALGDKLGLPVIHMDPFYFKPGWEQRPRPETDAMAVGAARGERWVVEGNNSSTFDARADLIVVLYLGRWRCFWRVIWRTLRYYGRNRPDMAVNCPERFERAFIFDWVLNYDTHSLPKAQVLIERWAGKRAILQLSSAAEINAFASDPRTALAKIDLPAAPR